MSTKIYIDPSRPRHRVSRYLYGQFAEHLGRCIYGGIWVGEDSSIPNTEGMRNDTIEALAALKLPVLRWPGGCFADNYHWIDGVGPRDKRPLRHNLHWVQPETNRFGTHEFMRFCELIGTEPYICLNVGSGTVEEARSWVEYCCAAQDTSLTRLRKENGRDEPWSVKFWGIGNENWGCGGDMRPEYYADLYRNYASYVRRTALSDAKLIACGSHPGIPEWDDVFWQRLADRQLLVDYIALHNYPNMGWGATSTGFPADHYGRLVVEGVQSIDDLIRRAKQSMFAYASKDHPVGLIMDEWGTWFADATVENGLYQQNTMQDALFAAAVFHVFHEHADVLFMANMAQTVNVLQSLILTKGPDLVLTPTYHVWEMFMPHRDADLVASVVIDAPTVRGATGERPAISVSATCSTDDMLFVSLVNLHPDSAVDIALELGRSAEWRVTSAKRLCGGALHAHNTFETPDTVCPEEISGAAGGAPTLTLPAGSIATLQFEAVRGA